MDRKVLTLEEIISLDRRPTLQEVLDLSLENYAKYLYHLGVISCVPENLEKYTEVREEYTYTGFFDNIVRLHKRSEQPLNENYWEINISDVNRIDEDKDDRLIESGYAEINGNKIFYELYDYGDLVSYFLNESGTMLSCPLGAYVGYMRNS